MSEVTLDSLNQKLDAVLAKLAPASVIDHSGEPYHHRQLMLAEIDPATIDGVTVQKDGSTWVMDDGVPKGLIYGYISPEKDPAMWDQLVAAFNGDEEHLVATLGIAFEPFLRWKNDPRGLVAATHDLPTLRMQLSQTFSAPLPPARPTV